MTDRVIRTHTPIRSIDELVARFQEGNKPRAAWRIGVEHEKLGVLRESSTPAPYSGARGIEALLEQVAKRGGWSRGMEGDRLISLAREGLRVTLEPGAQLELSGDPLATLADAEREVVSHLDELRPVADALGIAWIGLGFRPFGALDEIEWVPKGRYGVMREVLPTKGMLGHDMMKRTATVQANLDYADEDDARRKMRAAMSVTSLVTGLFAASPLVEGKDTGYASYRAGVWLDTDPARCGLLPFAFDDGPLFRQYTDWALDVPLLFLYRGDYRIVKDVTFRRFLREGLNGEQATLEDWDTHLSTLFPEARLKNYLEVRGADAGPLAMVLALPALWKGLLYDDDACRAAIELTARLSMPERIALRAALPLSGLLTKLPDGRTVGEAARELVGIAHAGLARLAPHELRHLAPLEEIAATGRTTSEKARDLWKQHPGDRAGFVKALAL